MSDSQSNDPFKWNLVLNAYIFTCRFGLTYIFNGYVVKFELNILVSNENCFQSSQGGLDWLQAHEDQSWQFVKLNYLVSQIYN